MTRSEYNEFRKRRSDARKYSQKGNKPIEVYIPISYSVEMKKKLVRMYNEILGFFITSVGIPQNAPFMGESIIMIEYDNIDQYLTLTSTEEQLRFLRAVNY